jgi:hypothetical protein
MSWGRQWPRRQVLQMGGALLAAYGVAGCGQGSENVALGNLNLSKLLARWEVGIGADPGRFLWEIESDPQVAAVAQGLGSPFLERLAEQL